MLLALGSLGAGTGKAAAKPPTASFDIPAIPDIPVHCEAGAVAVAVKRSGGADGASGSPQ
ncbi:uncharacterized protein N7473_009939 [Penicillium subrubescens]|jgi:hypothetical protein|uniref:uncharacterized protein n=1 Tax=Penicillium subrubescens TaxID=1316194 RepID=UPI0025457FD9|nr:uncharacterized protein N7473_009939 [Penicillium subrubescens]KAJ5883053.1 hypothetical protein N7473_009939 [Penicillium subrubescens]